MDTLLLHTETGRATIDDAGVATLLLDMPGGVNKIGAGFLRDIGPMVDAIAAAPGLRGVLVESAHKDFCVGADLDMVFAERDASRIYAASQALHAALRRLETLAHPVVALVRGAALGGGYELALAAHHRIGVDAPGARVGLPEVQLGVIPGGGGTQRLPRILGAQAALEHMLLARTPRIPAAREAGLLDALAEDLPAARAAGRAWIAAHPGAVQPWDAPTFAWPGVAPGTEAWRHLFMGAAAMLFGRSAGVFRAPEVVLEVVQEGGGLRFDRALEVEARAFAAIVVSDGCKDMIRTVWYSRNAAERQVGLPALAPGASDGIARVVVLGAGMMGGGLAALLAERGFSVVLKDIHPAALDTALGHARAHLARRLRAPGRAEEAFARIAAHTDDAAVDGADLLIEAVVEDVTVKHAVLGALETRLAPAALWATNTSALPVSELGAPSRDPSRFLGLHFFSPVEQMPLVEVVQGPATAPEAVARALSFCRRLGKTPILVNDGYGFYTTRVFAAYILEGVQLLAEGFAPALIEWGARAAGMVVPPLQVFDEVALSLGRKVLDQAEARTGRVLPAARALLVEMVDGHGRHGRAQGAGFYQYDGPAGKRRGLWPGLAPLVAGLRGPERAAPAADAAVLGRRLLLAQSVEAVRALEEGVLRAPADGDVGALLGIGFAPQTGGPFVFLDRLGLPAAVAALDALAAVHGPRFAPPGLLRRMAAAGEHFHVPV
jgi:3-hydroxyacyl-CoA dehydrogenase/enoyl-CoA hydratase/3-hydroxybutyryl-CoA epimerase